MGRIIFAMEVPIAVFCTAPAVAATAQQKTETCEFGADDQKLTGAARKSFLSKCMANRDSPRGKPAARRPQ